jgi:hypothetical protein
MAERAFYIVPADPLYLPDEAARAATLSFFQEVSPLPNANGDYYFRVYDQVQLIDCGEGLDAVVCPKCCKRLKISGPPDEAEYGTWWKDGFNLPLDLASAQLTMPCCEARIRFLDLKFDGACAFARFAVGALEPSDSDYWEDEDRPYGFLKKSTLDQFEKIMGCGVIQIWEIC